MRINTVRSRGVGGFIGRGVSGIVSSLGNVGCWLLAAWLTWKMRPSGENVVGERSYPLPVEDMALLSTLPGSKAVGGRRS